MKTVETFSFKGKKALIRVDYNVPLGDSYVIQDDSRMTASLPTIQKILNDGGSVVLMSHLGRPKNGPENKFSLKHLVLHLETLTGANVVFSDDCMSQDAINTSKNLKVGTIHLLENLRFYTE
ncbi:MAG: phosphoglycerate kinase, partial [Gammaproteobacteria bacterium]